MLNSVPSQILGKSVPFKWISRCQSSILQSRSKNYRSLHSNVANIFRMPQNEPILGYKKGSVERKLIEEEILKIKNSAPIEIPLIIGGTPIKTGHTGQQLIPHDHKKVLAVYQKASQSQVDAAIHAAMVARKTWSEMPLYDRLSIFQRAAELLATPSWRAKICAATVLGQSKNFYQAEIDAACELIDFLRFNVHYAANIDNEQPLSSQGSINRLVYRPLEGFVYAVSPFNFTAIGGNLATSPAIMGNVVLWKPSDSAVLSNYYIMELLQEAGLPPGVINFIPGEAAPMTAHILDHHEFSGIHYTGSTEVFQHIWSQIGHNIQRYHSFPRIVGETGGKGFVFAHSSANIKSLCVALIRGSFEYAGQKCSAASRAYIPESIWPSVRQELVSMLKNEVVMGNPESTKVLVNAVIHKGSFARCKEYIDNAKSDSSIEILSGGNYNDSQGYFIEPTIFVTRDPFYKSMVTEIFGPILTICIYKDAEFAQTLALCDQSTKYSLTGSIFAEDRQALITADRALVNAAGNFYINDKPTGAVVGQQPFGGARGSGTNDKAGSHLNLLRWTSPRTVKETIVQSKQVLYPYMTEL